MLILVPIKACVHVSVLCVGVSVVLKKPDTGKKRLLVVCKATQIRVNRFPHLLGGHCSAASQSR